MTRDALPSSQPSAIHASAATMKMTKPATIARAFQLAPTRTSGEDCGRCGKGPE
jgi:hypothetical protein